MDIQEILENFEFLDTGEERYRYIIDLGKGLAGLDEAHKTEANRVHGCQSRVWMVASVPVLMSLHPELSEAEAETLREHAERVGFESVDDFLGHEAVSRLELEPEELPISVSSSYFRVSTQVETVYGQLRLESLLERDGESTPRVIRRTMGRAG